MGYNVLIEKYQFRNHTKDFAKASQLLGPHFEELIANQTAECQFPDLLAYRGQEWHLVEVKRDRDVVRPSQVRYFKTLEEIFQTEIHLVKVKPA